MTQLNAQGEIVDVQEADQFQQNKTQFACGYFTCAMARSMAKVGEPPTLSIQQVIADGEAWYAQYNGNNAITNTSGMTLEQLYELLHQIGLHYQSTATDINVVKKWIEVGYPVIVAVTEVSVIDVELGRNPYPWKAAGTHIFFIDGITSDGNVLVRDPANCTNLYDPNSLRPGPRKYKADVLQLVSATVAVPPWMPQPTSNTPPEGVSMNLPPDWSDDGTTLKTASGELVLGFRAHVLPLLLAGKWNPANQPLGKQYYTKQLEASNPLLGDGDQIILTEGMLGYPHNPQAPYEGMKNKVIEEYVGTELDFTRKQVAKYYNLAASAQAQVAQLQAQIAQLQQTNPDALAAIHQAQAILAPFK